MKMILILTNKDDITVDFVVKELQSRKLAYYRLNTEDIPNRIRVSFDFKNSKFEIYDKIKNVKYNLLDFQSVYYRRPQINSLEYIDNISKQERIYLKSELAFLLEGIYKLLENKYWLNNVYRIREAENKVYQLKLAKEIGFKIPNSLISNDVSSAVQFVDVNNNCIIKPIKSGNMKDSKEPKAIFTTRIDNNQLSTLERIESFPLYLQNEIPKKYDLRVTVVGNDIFPVEIHSQKCKGSEVDWRKGLEIPEHYEHSLPIQVKNMCIELTHRLKLNYSAIDLIYDTNGQYIFLEINPNGQWAWIEKQLNLPISKKIVELLRYGEVSNVEEN